MKFSIKGFTRYFSGNNDMFVFYFDFDEPFFPIIYDSADIWHCHDHLWHAKRAVGGDSGDLTHEGSEYLGTQKARILETCEHHIG